MVVVVVVVVVMVMVMVVCIGVVELDEVVEAALIVGGGLVGDAEDFVGRWTGRLGPFVGGFFGGRAGVGPFLGVGGGSCCVSSLVEALALG